MEVFEFKTQIVKALSNPIRFAICEYLLSVESPICVNHIAEHFHLNQSSVSKHLSILQNVAIVNIKKDNVYVRYYINDKEALKCFMDAVNKLSENKIKQHSNIYDSFYNSTEVKFEN